jgi:alpha-ketoglutarate-dependent 2,4-dichlorophenoxyacetate dioxygenase
MTFQIKTLRHDFVGEVSGINLVGLHDDATLEALRRVMDDHGVLIFHDQPFSNEAQLEFAQRFDGALHGKTSSAVLTKNRFGNEALSDISNVGQDGEILPPADRRRVSSLANQLWHTDASFVDPPGRYSMLSARVIPPVRADTQFADMCGAYDALDEATRSALEGLQVHHSIAYSRAVLGFDFSADEKEKLKGAVHPLVRTLPNGRRSLYLASHASSIIGWLVPEARMQLRELIEHATQPRFVYAHEWRVGDLAIWDNRRTMHRGRPFDDKTYRRELRRTTTLDLPQATAVTNVE